MINHYWETPNYHVLRIPKNASSSTACGIVNQYYPELVPLAEGQDDLIWQTLCPIVEVATKPVVALTRPVEDRFASAWGMFPWMSFEDAMASDIAHFTMPDLTGVQIFDLATQANEFASLLGIILPRLHVSINKPVLTPEQIEIVRGN